MSTRRARDEARPRAEIRPSRPPAGLHPHTYGLLRVASPTIRDGGPRRASTDVQGCSALSFSISISILTLPSPSPSRIWGLRLPPPSSVVYCPAAAHALRRASTASPPHVSPVPHLPPRISRRVSPASRPPTFSTLPPLTLALALPPVPVACRQSRSPGRG
ncbi:hypothetical protein B0H15DRAFT_957451 [Mycena belliarum]|uniref:Uncharacterized protein n=1 Tax=Mycena belliarum TaxID=1033014 RepID=A0AAD6TNP2_9AGAR|nr:hypothetical protein B0H15DRAFT_957451 [Mycena belliae]